LAHRGGKLTGDGLGDLGPDRWKALRRRLERSRDGTGHPGSELTRKVCPSQGAAYGLSALLQEASAALKASQSSSEAMNP
jgi:hypothetical protein